MLPRNNKTIGRTFPLFKPKKDKIAGVLECYITHPDLSMKIIGSKFNLSGGTVGEYVSKHFFGTIRGEQAYITLPSKMNS